MTTRATNKLRQGFFLFCVAAVIGVCGAQPLDQASMSLKEQRQLEAGISGLVQDAIRANNMKFGSAPLRKPKVSYDQSSKAITIDLGRSAVPAEHTPTFDENLLFISQRVNDAVSPDVPIEVNFLFDGVDIYYFFPEDRGPVENPGVGVRSASTKSATSPVVLISAGHGLVLVNATKPTIASWAYQRPTIAGQIEDLQTPVLAAAVESAFSSRSSGVTTYLARSTSDDAHADACSGDPVVCPPFKNMAGRYYLKGLLPDRSDIWNNYSAENKKNMKDHEYDDIRSRGLYANYLQADQMITIHTNAASNAGTPQTTASGTRIFYNGSKTGAAALANNIACSAKEIINANTQYSSWSVTAQAPKTGYGENNFANLPAVVVEAGFKDNVNDAAAMADPSFQELIAKGIEKGARLSRESKTCTKFAVSTPNVSGSAGTTIPVTNNYVGNPRFPITRTSVVKSCGGGSCSGGTSVIQEVASPIMTSFVCNSIGSTSVTVSFHVTWVDSDGVKAEQDYSATCTA